MSHDKPEDESTTIHQLGFLEVKETGEETAKGLVTFLKPKARQQATASAATILTITSYPPTVIVTNLLDDLESLAKQTDGRATETLSVIIEDSDSTFEQFGYDIGGLTPKQGRVLFVQIVNRREVEESHERELEKVALKSSMSFFGKLFSKLFGAS